MTVSTFLFTARQTDVFLRIHQVVQAHEAHDASGYDLMQKCMPLGNELRVIRLSV